MQFKVDQALEQAAAAAKAVDVLRVGVTLKLRHPKYLF